MHVHVETILIVANVYKKCYKICFRLKTVRDNFLYTILKAFYEAMIKVIGCNGGGGGEEGEVTYFITLFRRMTFCVEIKTLCV